MPRTSRVDAASRTWLPSLMIADGAVASPPKVSVHRGTPSASLLSRSRRDRPATESSDAEGGIETMPLTTPRELFVHELSDAMSAEQIILKLLPELGKEARHPELKRAFEEHEAETRDQVKNLEQVFERLGEAPEATTCHAAEGLKREHEALHEEEPSPEILELGNAAGAAKTEHYEIATYTALQRMARDLGEREVVKLLGENLAQEKAMAKRVETLAKQLGKDAKEAAKA
jgi:ferritin-like metal-binding protein YciE